MTEIVEWPGIEQPVKELWFCQEEQGDSTVQAQCVEAGSVALHVMFPGADEGDEDRRVSIYFTPAEAALFSEQLRTVAFIAEKLASDSDA